MRIIPIALLAAAVAFSLAAHGQGSTVPTKACGTWQFEGQGHQAGGALAILRFSFAPTQQRCGVDPCMCNKIAYIQVIRARDMDKSRYIQPFEEQEDRMIVSDTPELNGWAVDRLDTNDWGYFAAIDTDPVTFGSNVVVGTNATTPKKRARLSDQPERYPRRVRFEAISVPVCMDENGACGNKMLGFRTWKFRVQDNKHGTNPTHAASTHWELEAVKAAIEKWDEMAVGSLQEFPDALEPLSEE